LAPTAVIGPHDRASAASLESCCMAAARQKGYSGAKASCYASVCTKFLTMESDGKGCSASGRIFTTYARALLDSCQIQR
jgi:hypothetical protein